jgi:hypothetical protein
VSSHQIIPCLNLRRATTHQIGAAHSPRNGNIGWAASPSSVMGPADRIPLDGFESVNGGHVDNVNSLILVRIRKRWIRHSVIAKI